MKTTAPQLTCLASRRRTRPRLGPRSSPAPSLSLQPFMAASRRLQMEARKLPRAHVCQRTKENGITVPSKARLVVGGTADLKGKGVGRGGEPQGEGERSQLSPLVCFKSDSSLTASSFWLFNLIQTLFPVRGSRKRSLKVFSANLNGS